MLSLIVCHRNKEQLANFKASVTQSCEGEYEFIIIDNTKNAHSIFEAYNLGIDKASGDILAFCHEDILFETQAWDKKLYNHFSENSKLGLVGCVGGTALPASPAPWWNRNHYNTHFIHLLQKWKDGDNSHRWSYNEPYKNTDLVLHKENSTGKVLNQVTAVDGFFMAMPKQARQVVKFDTHTFKGFHCYDLDICMQINKAGMEVAVAHDFLVAHLSTGSVNESWANESVKFCTKWQSLLPHSTQTLSESDKIKYTNQQLLTFIYWNIDKLQNSEIRRIIKLFMHKDHFFRSENYRLLSVWNHTNLLTAKLINKLFKWY